MDAFHAELLPEDKAKFIKEFQKEAPTAMTGDGLNDAPALATADIGISMGVSGSALAMETGHVILTSNDLGRIPKAIRLARRVRRKIIENVIVSITIKAAILALAISGHPFVWAAVFADVGSCLIVIFNSLLLLRRTAHRHGNKCCKSSSVSHTHQHCKSSHIHQQPCCSNTESSKTCKSQTCSGMDCSPTFQSDSSSLCGNKQCPDSTSKKDCHSQTNPHSHSSKMSTSRCCNSRSCSKDRKPDENGHHSHNTALHEKKELGKACLAIGTQDIELGREHGHDCSNHSNSHKHEHSESERGHDFCAPNEHCSVLKSHDHQISKAKHHAHDSHRCCASTLDLEKNEVSNNHCHANHSVDHCKSEGTNEEIHFQCKKHHAVECSQHVSSVNIMNGSHHHVDCCAPLKALEKRHAGDCCKSFRNECCGKSSHFGSNFGGISEIVIE